MAPIEPVPPTEQFDASALEKDLHTNSSLEGNTARNSTTEGLSKAESHRYLNENDALDWVRKNPNSDEPIYITYSADDKDNPRNWSKARKWYITVLVSMSNVLTCLCAGGWSSGAAYAAAGFGVSAEVSTLGLAMYVLGFAVGPLVLAPLSEYYGRSPIYFVAYVHLVRCQRPSANSEKLVPPRHFPDPGRPCTEHWHSHCLPLHRRVLWSGAVDKHWRNSQ